MVAERVLFDQILEAVTPKLLAAGYEIYEERACHEVYDSCFVVFACDKYDGYLRLSWDGKEKLLLFESAPEPEADYTAVLQRRFTQSNLTDEEAAAVVGEVMGVVEAFVKPG